MLTDDIADLYDSSVLLHRAVSTLPFLPSAHITAFEHYVRALSPTTANPYAVFHSSLLAMQSTIDAILTALTRPPRLISQMNAAKKTVDKNFSSISRSTRWPLGLLDDTRQRLNEEREEKARAGQAEVDNLSRELRYTQQTVAAELAGWQDMHERMGRRAIRELARGMVVVEKMRLEGMRRALRKLKNVYVDGAPGSFRDGGTNEGGDDAAAYSSSGPPLALAGLEMAHQNTGIGIDLPLNSGSVPASMSAPAPAPASMPAPEAEAGDKLDDTSAAAPSGQIADEPSEEPRQSPLPRSDLFGEPDEDEGGSASGQIT